MSGRLLLSFELEAGAAKRCATCVKLAGRHLAGGPVRPPASCLADEEASRGAAWSGRASDAGRDPTESGEVRQEEPRAANWKTRVQAEEEAEALIRSGGGDSGSAARRDAWLLCLFLSVEMYYRWPAFHASAPRPSSRSAGAFFSSEPGPRSAAVPGVPAVGVLMRV